MAIPFLSVSTRVPIAGGLTGIEKKGFKRRMASEQIAHLLHFCNGIVAEFTKHDLPITIYSRYGNSNRGTKNRKSYKD